MAVDYAAGFLTDAGILLAPTSDGTSGQVIQTDGSGQLSFVDQASGASWGSITGTLADQTDLQTVLDGKIGAIGDAISSATAGSVLFAGSAGALSQNNSKLFWDDANARLGIKTSVPLAPVHISDGAAMPSSMIPSGAVFFSSKSGSNNDFYLVTAGVDGISKTGVFGAVTSRGTLASPTAVQSGDPLLRLIASGFDGTGSNYNGRLHFEVDGAVSTGTVPIAITFRTGSTGHDERMRIASGGDVGIGKSPGTMLDVAGTVRIGAYTFATVPSAAANEGAIIRISDRGQRQAYADPDGNWRFTADGTIIS